MRLWTCLHIDKKYYKFNKIHIKIWFKRTNSSQQCNTRKRRNVCRGYWSKCLRFYHFCFVMKWSSATHSISLFCHEMANPQTLYQSVLSWNGQASDIVSVCFVMIIMTKQTDTMSEVWPYHDKTDGHYVWGLTISWQNRLIQCLRFDHIMTKQTYGETSDIVSVCFVMIWSNLRHNISLFCHDMVKPQTLYQSVLSWYGQTHDKTDWYNVWGLTISWQNRLIQCLRFDHIMTKQTDTMSGASPYHDKTDWYNVWGSVLSWYGEAPDIVSVCFVMIWWNLRHCISLFCHDMVKPQT
jgi:hypothetical protein